MPRAILDEHDKELIREIGGEKLELHRQFRQKQREIEQLEREAAELWHQYKKLSWEALGEKFGISGDTARNIAGGWEGRRKGSASGRCSPSGSSRQPADRG